MKRPLPSSWRFIHEPCPPCIRPYSRNNKTIIHIKKLIKNKIKRGQKEEMGKEKPLPSSWRFLHETLASMRMKP